MHLPGTELLLPTLHPLASMYPGGPVSVVEVRAAHDRMREELQRHGIRVLTVVDVLQSCLPLEELQQLALDSVTYRLVHPNSSIASPSSATAALLSDDYKRAALSTKGREELVQLALLQPTLLLETSDATAQGQLRLRSTEVHPLSKLVFTRDQQLITARGVVLANLMFPNRQREPAILRRVWQALHVPIVAELRGEEKAEGGDFLSYSPDLCLIGVGLRTNWRAVERMLADDLFGTQRVVVVVDHGDRHHQRMHLDTVLNILAPGVLLVLEDILDDSRADRMRGVVEYRRGRDGRYEEVTKATLAEWLKTEGWQVVTATPEQQLDYMLNFLQLGWQGDRFAVVTSNAGLKELVDRAGLSGTVRVQHVEYGGGDGAVRSCALHHTGTASAHTALETGNMEGAGRS